MELKCNNSSGEIVLASKLNQQCGFTIESYKKKSTSNEKIAFTIESYKKKFKKMLRLLPKQDCL